MEDAASSIQGFFKIVVCKKILYFKLKQRYFRYFDENANCFYYYNDFDQTCSWSPPLLMHNVELFFQHDVLSLEDKIKAREKRKEEKAQVEMEKRNRERIAIEKLRDIRKNQLEWITKRVCVKNGLEKKHYRDIQRLYRKWDKSLKKSYSKDRAARLGQIKMDNQKAYQELYDGVKVVRLDSIREASLNGDAKRVLELIQTGHHVNAVSAMGLTPLIAASRSGSYDVVKVLLQNGAFVNQRHIVRSCILGCSGVVFPK